MTRVVVSGKPRPARCPACRRGRPCPCSPPCPPRSGKGAWVFGEAAPVVATAPRHNFTAGRCIDCGCRRTWITGANGNFWHYMPKGGQWGAARPECRAMTLTPATRPERTAEIERRVQVELDERQARGPK